MMSSFAVKLLVFALFFGSACPRHLKDDTFGAVDVVAFNGPLDSYNTFDPLNNKTYRWCESCALSDCGRAKKKCLEIGNLCGFQVIEFPSEYQEGCCTCHSQ